MIALENVTYDYASKAGIVHALRDVSVVFEPARMYAITGRSGSGKTTLLSLIAGLDVPLQGRITVSGTDISAPYYLFYSVIAFCTPVESDRGGEGIADAVEQGPAEVT